MQILHPGRDRILRIKARGIEKEHQDLAQIDLKDKEVIDLVQGQHHHLEAKVIRIKTISATKERLSS